jgi:hypothetical protein
VRASNGRGTKECAEWHPSFHVFKKQEYCVMKNFQEGQPDLTPDQFLYQRKGPWPQPSPTHPLQEAAEVLNIPPIETLMWNSTIGTRLLETQFGYPGLAAAKAMEAIDLPIPSDDQFNNLMLNTAYSRFMKPASDADWIYLDKSSSAAKVWKYDFSAMKLVQPLDGLYCAAVFCLFVQDAGGKRSCNKIVFRGANSSQNVAVGPADPVAVWNLAKIFALQGAAYHMLFVVHPALHFPMDSVNAITKTTVPQSHPLFQTIYPHTSYTLALDNAVLEGPESVVNNNAQGTWFDPLMGNAYNLKLLFGAGYAGLADPWYGDAYPAYDYMKPQMGFDSDYGRWLAAYFPPFQSFCKKVATEILTADKNDTYVTRWARHNASYIKGFPDEKSILDMDCLAQVLAIYLWDVTVSHGGDHYSFGRNVPAPYKFLRVRHRSPTVSPEPVGITAVGDVSSGDDLYRSEMAQEMFFGPHAMFPNLRDTLYPFTNKALFQAQNVFKIELEFVSTKFKYAKDTPFMPLNPQDGDGKDAYSCTIPASIQY